jgi:prepilin peptidase CpaA
MLQYLIYAALLGGALTLLILAFRRYPMPDWLLRHKWIDRLHDTKSGVPYGIALAIAGILVYPETPIFVGLLGG